VLTVSYRMMVLDGATSRATCVDDTLAFDLAVGDFDSDARVPVGLHAALYLAPVDLPVVVVLNPELAFGEVGVPDLAIPAFAQVIVNATVTASVQQAGGARAASSGASRVSRRRFCVFVYEPVAAAVAIALFLLLPPLPYTVVAAAPSPASVDAHLETVAVSLCRVLQRSCCTSVDSSCSRTSAPAWCRSSSLARVSSRQSVRTMSRTTSPTTSSRRSRPCRRGEKARKQRSRRVSRLSARM
jgi:hypothetical protein